ncbi:sporulation integral membrane protein YtvI [Alkalibacillus haloalkaliphilus]|uniref:sporulation integral membrane protein YtvI n=1 Tax=Alkalibacillus haloalkaliphilus TaxID=94136 RepID=UPI0003154367|nr:sporulation integral membrane protein YtvI [Alkalibacillus haloalkaliphilus]
MELNYSNLIKLVTFSIGFVTVMYFGFYYLFPILLSVILAFLINPFVNFVQAYLRNRALSVLFVLCFFFISFISIISLSIVEFIHLLQHLTMTTPVILEDLFRQVEQYTTQTVEQVYQTIENFASTIHPESSQLMKNLLSDMTNSMKEVSKDWLIHFLQSAMNQLTYVIQGGYILFFVLIGTYFLSKDGPKWFRNVLEHMPERTLSVYSKTKSEITYLIKKYLFAQFLLIVITGLIVYAGLLIFSVEHALAIAFVAMFLDLIPLVGVSGLFVPWLIYLFMTDQFTLTIQLSLLLIVIIITRNLLEPKLIGAQLGTHPFFVLILLFILISTFGILGIFLSPIIMIIIVALMRANLFTHVKNYIVK